MIRDCIFDLYGTLIDVGTDWGDPGLWQLLRDFCAACGADWEEKELKDAFRRFWREEEAALAERLGCPWPEIEARQVFRRLYLEAPQRHESSAAPNAETLDRWCEDAAILFRVRSRKRFRLYPGTVPTLRELRERGLRIWLLSNASAVFTRPELEVIGILPLFDGVYLSSDYGIRKPSPDFMRCLLQERKIRPEEALMVGNDFASDMELAARSGVRGAYLNTDGLSQEEMEARRDALLPARIDLIPSGEISELLFWPELGAQD